MPKSEKKEDIMLSPDYIERNRPDYAIFCQFMGDRLKKLRKAANITQQKMGDSIGIDRSVISDWENGTPISSYWVDKVSEYFHISPSFFFDDNLPYICDIDIYETTKPKKASEDISFHHAQAVIDGKIQNMKKRTVIPKEHVPINLVIFYLPSAKGDTPYVAKINPTLKKSGNYIVADNRGELHLCEFKGANSPTEYSFIKRDVKATERRIMVPKKNKDRIFENLGKAITISFEI